MRELAALERLHDHDAHALAGGVIQSRLAGLEARVGVVVLHLAERPLVVLVADAHEVGRLAVERERRETDEALCLRALEELDDAQVAHSVPRLAIEAVEQVEVEVVGLKPLELLGKEAVHVGAFLEEEERHLGREVDALAPTSGERFADKRLALALRAEVHAMVEVRRVDVVHAVVDGVVQQLGSLGIVDLVGFVVDDRQTHASEAEHGHINAGPAETPVQHWRQLLGSRFWISGSRRALPTMPRRPRPVRAVRARALRRPRQKRSQATRGSSTCGHAAAHR